MPGVDDPAPGPLFRAELRPNSSASPRAFCVLAGLLCALAGATATAFLLLGAWPILPFMGAEVGLALLLMRWHRRGTLRERELLELTAGEFRLTRTARDGAVSSVALEPYWLRLERTTPPPCLWLASHGRRLRIGRALTEEELGELHEALRAALARWRAGPEGTR
jgi:uncharacterized membrane protein